MAETEADEGWEARLLLRGARMATLATCAAGQPFASLVTPATAPDLSPLMLLSSLSEHTRHLREEPRCSLMVTGPVCGPNPQTTARLTVTGIAEPVADPALKARWLAVHPYAALYADFGDFSLWRVRLCGALLVAGFARAHRLKREALLPKEQSVLTVAAAESGILAHCNEDHADAVALIAREAGGGNCVWRMVTADVDGCDLVAGETVMRIPWSAPVQDADGIRAELITLARAHFATTK
jgi:heme iron utilization protein